GRRLPRAGRPRARREAPSRRARREPDGALGDGAHGVSAEQFGATLHAAAYAKVNLALAVGRAEGPKGWHPIASWMACVDLRDDMDLLALDPSRASRYAILWADDAPKRSDIDWPIAKDLAVRARSEERRVGEAC